MKLVGRRKVKDQKVYDIGLAGPHNFVLANGTVASNCFNKAHSYSYALIAYYEAYIKAHYPAEFFAALLTHADKADKVARYIAEAKSMGVDVHGPSVNDSDWGFQMNEGQLYYGLKGIKGLGNVAVRSILRARGTMPFKDIWGFCDRVDLRKVNKSSMDALIKAGAFDCIGYDRETLLESTASIVKYYQDLAKWYERRDKAAIQNAERKRLDENPELVDELREKAKAEGKRFSKPRILEVPPKPERPEISPGDRVRITPSMLDMEREVLGCTVTAHPTDFIRLSGDMLRVEDLVQPGQRGKVGVVVVGKPKIHKTKNGHLMAFCAMEDATGRLDVTVFPQQYRKYKEALQEGKILILRCSVDKRPDRAAATPRPVVADHISVLRGE